MDRFIVITNIPKAKIGLVLKSNMDRFIVQKLPRNRRYNKYLKSNMDRFIDFAYFEFPQPAEFKIQYG